MGLNGMLGRAQDRARQEREHKERQEEGRAYDYHTFDAKLPVLFSLPCSDGFADDTARLFAQQMMGTIWGARYAEWERTVAFYDSVDDGPTAPGAGRLTGWFTLDEGRYAYGVWLRCDRQGQPAAYDVRQYRHSAGQKQGQRP